MISKGALIVKIRYARCIAVDFATNEESNNIDKQQKENL